MLAYMAGDVSAARRRDNDELVGLARLDHDRSVVLHCECDDPACNALVVVHVADFERLRTDDALVLAHVTDAPV